MAAVTLGFAQASEAMPRYKLRTLLILLAILPPLMWIGWTKYEAWRAERDRQEALKRIRVIDTKPALAAPPAATIGPADLGPWYPGVTGNEGPPGFGQPQNSTPATNRQ